MLIDRGAHSGIAGGSGPFFPRLPSLLWYSNSCRECLPNESQLQMHRSYGTWKGECQLSNSTPSHRIGSASEFHPQGAGIRNVKLSMLRHPATELAHLNCSFEVHVPSRRLTAWVPVTLGATLSEVGLACVVRAHIQERKGHAQPSGGKISAAKRRKVAVLGPAVKHQAVERQTQTANNKNSNNNTKQMHGCWNCTDVHGPYCRQEETH